MSFWPPDVSQGSGPVYRRVADAIGQAIESGSLPPGSRLPSHRDMAYQLGVAVGSVAKAYGLLADRGQVQGRVGHGTVVRAADQDADQAPLTADRAAVDMGLATAPPLSDPELIDAAGRRTLADIAAQWPLLGLADYPPEGGIERQQKAAARWLRGRGLPASAETVFITIGAQEALLAILMTFARGGVPLLCEALTAVATKNLFFATGNPAEAVALDAEGLLPEALDEAAARSGSPLVVLRPSLQIPTAARMSQTRRDAIVEVARARDLLIVEIDSFAEFLPDRDRPLAALAPERAFFVSSLASQTQPGLRSALLHAPPALVERLRTTRHANLIGTPTLIGEVVCSLIQSGVAERLTAAHRQELKARHAILRTQLDGLAYTTRPFAPFIWLTLAKGQAADLAAQAAERGVRLLPAERFAIGASQPPQALRLAISSPPDRASLTRGLAVVRALLSGD
ncbi:MAG: PLP-dependent aminotransferase family protein [Rhodospirillales bacterium]